jgi:hypothetical protein
MRCGRSRSSSAACGWRDSARGRSGSARWCACGWSGVFAPVRVLTVGSARLRWCARRVVKACAPCGARGLRLGRLGSDWRSSAHGCWRSGCTPTTSRRTEARCWSTSGGSYAGWTRTRGSWPGCTRCSSGPWLPSTSCSGGPRKRRTARAAAPASRARRALGRRLPRARGPDRARGGPGGPAGADRRPAGPLPAPTRPRRWLVAALRARPGAAHGSRHGQGHRRVGGSAQARFAVCGPDLPQGAGREVLFAQMDRGADAR